MHGCAYMRAEATSAIRQIRVFNGATRTIGQPTNIEPSPPPLPHRAGDSDGAEVARRVAYPDTQPSAASIRVPESAQRHTTFGSMIRDGSVG